jgi:hypothetical protein
VKHQITYLSLRWVCSLSTQFDLLHISRIHACPNEWLLQPQQSQSPWRLRPLDTSSRCRAGTVTATHDFEVSNFSLLNGNIGAGRSISSTPFHAGGYNWMIEFYPDGTHHRAWFGHAAAAYMAVCENSDLSTYFYLLVELTATE